MLKQIPITAITGFLGSGKTTLLNYVLEHNQGLKIGVVVNDYGAINIDAELIAGRADAMMELTNGCMCCSLDELQLDEAIGQFALQGSQIDYILIEASGLAEPGDLASTLREASGQHTKLDSIVAVLDAENIGERSDQNSLGQIEHSDFVVINKIDLVRPKKIQTIKALVNQVNERARIFTSSRGEIDVQLLLDQEVHDPRTKSSGNDHIHDQYQKVYFTSDRPLDPAGFQTFVNEQLPTEVYRAKGFVNLGKKGRDRKYTFQLVGKRAEMTWTEWSGQAPKTELVFIGRGFDSAKLLQQIEKCIDAQPQIYDRPKPILLPRREPRDI